MEKQIEHLMSVLNVSKEEALQIIVDDKAIDQGKDLFPLTAEQKKAEKKARGTGTKAVYNFSKRERKTNAPKADLISRLVNFLFEQNDLQCVVVTNKEREITFEMNGLNFQLNLIQKREKKT